MTSPVARVIRARRPITVAVLLSVAALAIGRRPQAAAAHPLGNFTINRYAQIALQADTAHVVYALDMAEIPTFQELDVIDRDHNGTVSDVEKSAYLGKKLPELAKNLKLTVNGAAVPFHVESGELSFTEGQGGLKILRIDAVFTGKLPDIVPRGTVDALVSDHNFDDRSGWKEIVVVGSDSGAVSGSSVPDHGVSDVLHSYPQNMLASPLNVREARFRLEPGGTIMPDEKVRALGWSPRVSFEEGLAQTVSWYHENAWWWQPIRSGDYRAYYERQYGRSLG